MIATSMAAACTDLPVIEMSYAAHQTENANDYIDTSKNAS